MVEGGPKLYKQYSFSSLFTSLSRKTNDDPSLLIEAVVSDNKQAELNEQTTEPLPSKEERDTCVHDDCSVETPGLASKVSSSLKSSEILIRKEMRKLCIFHP